MLHRKQLFAILMLSSTATANGLGPVARAKDDSSVAPKESLQPLAAALVEPATKVESAAPVSLAPAVRGEVWNLSGTNGLRPVVQELATDRWSGFYAGGTVGLTGSSYDGIYDSSDLNEIPPDSHIVLSNLDSEGAALGGFFGWNHRMEQYVLGFEADIAWVDLDESSFEPEDGSEEANAKLDFCGSARVRGGVVANDFLFYGTAGLAYVSGDYTVKDDGDGDGSLSLDQVGLAVGGGAEWAMGGNMTLRLEGLYHHFGKTFDASDVTADSDPDDEVELESMWVVRAGISFGL